MFTNPTIADFKAFFVRDFPYGATTATVMDADLTRALDETALFINQGLFCTQAEYTTAFLYLMAHNLVMNLRASSQGISGNYAWLQTSRGAGSVSESVSIPQQIMENPQYATLAKTNYGVKFLMLVWAQLVGSVYSVAGRTNP